MDNVEHGTFGKPDEVRESLTPELRSSRSEPVKSGATPLNPSGVWPNDVTPIAKTESCQAPTSRATPVVSWRS